MNPVDRALFDKALAERDLRDRFAIAALTAILSNPNRPPQHVDEVADGIKGGMIEARAAYGWADAMMKARGQ